MLSKESCIMVVDDMKMMRRAITMYLKSLGYSNFIEAESGADAVNKYKSNKVDFTFMDIVMPIKDGYEALQEIRAENNSAAIAMLTSVADEDILSKCIAEGAIGVILKPLTKENGADKLKAILEKIA